MCSICCSKQMLLQFCTEHGSHTAVLCAKFRKDPATKWMLLLKEISRDLSFWGIFAWLFILLRTPGSHCTARGRLSIRGRRNPFRLHALLFEEGSASCKVCCDTRVLSGKALLWGRTDLGRALMILYIPWKFKASIILYIQWKIFLRLWLSPAN